MIMKFIVQYSEVVKVDKLQGGGVFCDPNNIDCVYLVGGYGI